jgi:3-hydroxyisobutyrate dehydrogenase-like beta-hydroxyacid dehydrogenase
VVFISLPMPDTVMAVTTGENGLAGGRALKTVIDLSTTGPKVAADVARSLAQRNITFVDCPVSGGVARAVNGTLALMVSCPRATFDEVTPLLKYFGQPTFIGEAPGAAQMMKLCNNLMAAASMAIAAEAVTAGVKAGIDPAIMIDVINASSGRNNATVDKFPTAVLTRKFSHGFATGLMFKDVRLCLEEAQRMGLDLEVAAAVQSVWKKTNEEYGPESDHTTIVKLVERSAGVTVGREAQA